MNEVSDDLFNCTKKLYKRNTLNLDITSEEEVDLILKEAGGLPPYVYVEDVS